jgi:hypothetical protein
MTATEPAPATDSWNQQLAQLKARYRQVREPILVALNILLGDENISIDDAKAQAQLRGVRITAASINAAKTLLAKMDSPPTPLAVANSEPAPPTRRPRAADKSIDAETLVRTFVAKLQGQGNAEAERLREAMRKAVATLQAALEVRTSPFPRTARDRRSSLYVRAGRGPRRLVGGLPQVRPAGAKSSTARPSWAWPTTTAVWLGGQFPASRKCQPRSKLLTDLHNVVVWRRSAQHWADCCICATATARIAAFSDFASRARIWGGRMQ